MLVAASDFWPSALAWSQLQRAQGQAGHTRSSVEANPPAKRSRGGLMSKNANMTSNIQQHVFPKIADSKWQQSISVEKSLGFGVLKFSMCLCGLGQLWSGPGWSTPGYPASMAMDKPYQSPTNGSKIKKVLVLMNGNIIYVSAIHFKKTTCSLHPRTICNIRQ